MLYLQYPMHMSNLRAHIIDNFPNIEDFEDKEEYYDGYWQLVLDYPLIFLPNNKIIFWGFEVKILKNEYDMLKSIIKLNSETSTAKGFTEEQIIENIYYKRVNSRVDKLKSYQNFIKTSKSRIKKQLTDECVNCCINCITFNLFNPFINDKVAKKFITRKNIPTNDKTFRDKVLNANINLTKIFTYMLNFTTPYDENYSSFLLKNALDSLLYISEYQEPNSKHKFYKTEFIFNDIPFVRNNKMPERQKGKDDRFRYAKTTPTRYNLYDFLN